MVQIEVRDLVKDYKRKLASEGFAKGLKDLFAPNWETIRAIDHINFQIDEGEAVGYIGPNGSGKSTTIKMLTGILRPTSGKVLTLGREPMRHRNRVLNNREIGVVFGQRSVLNWDVPIIDSYKLLKVLYRIPNEQFERNLDMLSEIIGLRDLLNVPERQLSLGQKMRCNVAAAFLHEPKIVFLDEPTVGIDISAKADIRQLIKDINIEKKTTFILTSHDFRDIESICRRLIIIDKGIVVADTTVDEMRKVFGNVKTITFTLENVIQDKSQFKIDGIEDIIIEENKVEIIYDINNYPTPKLISFVTDIHNVLDISIQEPPIESIVEDILNKK
jgi:ABC-2 type transport system ATP-binding protein